MGTFSLVNNTKDKDLYERLGQEQVQLYGTDLEYWTISRDTTKDTLYADDTLPIITGKYNIKGYGQPITEYFTLSKFGFQSPDVIEFMISKKEFHEVLGDNVEPLWGDLIYIPFMQRTFVIANIHHEENVFLWEKMSYKFILNAADKDAIVDNTGLDNDAINAWTASGTDTLEDTFTVTTCASDIVVSKPDDQNVFGEWE